MVNIGQRFLDEPVKSPCNGREACGCRIDMNGHVQPGATPKTICQNRQRLRKAKLLQQWRVCQIGDGANFILDIVQKIFNRTNDA